MKPKILAFAGSTRTGSLNKKLARVAAEAATRAGAEVTLIDLRDFPMPLYDGDLQNESGIPENGKKLKALMKAHHGFIIASPEYNSSYSGVLKNAIDWTSRSEPGEKELECYAGKTAAIVSTSPGALGGLRGLFQLRQLLSNIQVLVLPNQKAIPGGNKAFGEDGALLNAADQQAIDSIAQRLTEVVSRLAA